MITLRADADYGFGGKQHIGRVTGRDPKWGLKLEFVGTKGGKRNETTTFDTDEPGLYFVRGWTRKNIAREEFSLLIEVDGVLKEFAAEKADAMKIAKEMDAGRQLASIVTADKDGWEFVTAKQAESAAVAATIDTAIEACWLAIQALPDTHAKKVIAALKQRITPPKPAAAVGLVDGTPVGVVADANQDAGVSEQALGLAPTPVE